MKYRELILFDAIIVKKWQKKIEETIAVNDRPVQERATLHKDLLEMKSTKVFSVFLLYKIVELEFALHMVFTSTWDC